MERSLSPREIQARVRGGASIDQVAEESGASPERIAVFASPVIAEREHIARTALGTTVRRRGDGKGHRRLREIISERLRARSIDPDEVSWDAWREPDLRWRVVGTLNHEDNVRAGEFLFDPKARFSIADNGDARWLIGEEIVGSGDPDSENTIDFNDELALVRVIQAEPGEAVPAPGDEVPVSDSNEPPHTSELDDLYDMLSGVSEDSVRIYVGLEDNAKQSSSESDEDPDQNDDEAEFSSEQEVSDIVENLLREDEEPSQPEEVPEQSPEAITEPQQDSLIEEEPASEPAPEADAEAAPKKSRRKRAQVPSWDEIMFGGPTGK